MWRLSVYAILALFCIGCSHHIETYRGLKNIDIRLGGKMDSCMAEKSAKVFEDQWNKQFDSNIKMPRTLFNLGAYIDSIVNRTGIVPLRIEGEF